MMKKTDSQTVFKRYQALANKSSAESDNCVRSYARMNVLNPGLVNFKKLYILFLSICLFLVAKCMFLRVLNRMESTSLK